MYLGLVAKGCFFLCPELWNPLPSDIRSGDNIKIFKSNDVITSYFPTFAAIFLSKQGIRIVRIVIQFILWLAL